MARTRPGVRSTISVSSSVGTLPGNPDSTNGEDDDAEEADSGFIAKDDTDKIKEDD